MMSWFNKIIIRGNRTKGKISSIIISRCKHPKQILEQVIDVLITGRGELYYTRTK